MTLPRFFYDGLVFVDLELSADGKRLLRWGALRGEEHRAGGLADLGALDGFCAEADAVVGHNYFAFDRPALQGFAPELRMLQLPAIDTLILGPLAFPRRPYHALIKNYRPFPNGASDPVLDAQLCRNLLVEEVEAFGRLTREQRQLFRWCLEPGVPVGDWGFSLLFERMGVEPLSDEEVQGMLGAFPICQQARAELDLEKEREHLAFALAWLPIAEEGVIPAWVRARVPALARLLHRLREVPCGRATCTWCRESHSPEHQLERWFGLRSFRPKPEAPDGSSLQRRIVAEAMAGKDLLALLPTGAGKSLCYQLPALVRFQRRGLLTVVISPLQALMRDQVDGLERRTNLRVAAALHGLLTPLERSDVMDRLRSGELGLLYVSPEQLRNASFWKALEFREIAAWVFDEAHCLSTWGHDFRTDYFFASQAIGDWWSRHGPVKEPPTIQAFTATARPAVRQELLNHFQSVLGVHLEVYGTDDQRPNLQYRVLPVQAQDRLNQVREALEEYRGVGSAVVYFSSRQACEDAAAILHSQGQAAAAFHAGLAPTRKREVLDNFMQGITTVICATSAFGMGVDKGDIRLVVHAQVPGSLEAYLQEAGRAGRDGELATCLLLWSEQDLEQQFRLAASTQIRKSFIQRLLRVVRRCCRRVPDGQDRLVTVGELIREEEKDRQEADSEVRAALAWLEKGGFLHRGLNHTQVFTGRPRFPNRAAADQHLRMKHLPEAQRARQLILFERILQSRNEGLSADDLLPYLQSEENRSDQVIRLLNEMVESGLLESGLQMSALVSRDAEIKQSLLDRLEKALLRLLSEQNPDPDQEAPLDLREASRLLRQEGHENHPQQLGKLLRRLGTPNGHGQRCLEVRAHRKDVPRLRLNGTWAALMAHAQTRRQVEGRVLQRLLAPGTDPVHFSFQDLKQALSADLLLAHLSDSDRWIRHALLNLQGDELIHLQNGFGVFRQALRLRLNPDAVGRRFGDADYDPVQRHQRERCLQIHAMGEYAESALHSQGRANRLAADWFRLDRGVWLRRYMPGRAKELERPTGRRSWEKIVDSLGDTAQIAVVTAPAQEHLLVLAGPGSGKTRTLVHRVAWLLRVERVEPEGVVVLCFNRSAAREVRRRLFHLVGDDALRLTVSTFHAFSLRILGRNLAPGQAGEEELAEAVEHAAEILEGKGPLGDAGLGDLMAGGITHILVDEYQDVQSASYRMLCALARQRPDGEPRDAVLLAVGDDDQSIYDFLRRKDQDPEPVWTWIRRFSEEFEGKTYFLLHNYRSEAPILAAAQAVIAGNSHRRKQDHPLVIDPARQNRPSAWSQMDTVGEGRVTRLRCQGPEGILQELQRIYKVDPQSRWEDFAILARSRRRLGDLRTALEAAGLPCRWPLSREAGLPLWDLREVAAIHDRLEGYCRIADFLPPADSRNPWLKLLRAVLKEAEAELGTGLIPASRLRAELWEGLLQERREAAIGTGIRLSTLHGAKGLEFRHVVLMDGGWGQDDPEEERRLYYVGMTRARESLTLVDQGAPGNPAWKALPDLRLVESPPSPWPTGGWLPLSLADLDLGYAGSFEAGHPIHGILRSLQPGSSLEFVWRDGRGFLRSGRDVARLSAAGSERLGGMREARVLAMVVRRETQMEEAWRGRCKVGRWEVPLVEVRR